MKAESDLKREHLWLESCKFDPWTDRKNMRRERAVLTVPSPPPLRFLWTRPLTPNCSSGAAPWPNVWLWIGPSCKNERAFPWIRSQVFKPQAVTHHRMRVAAPQTPSVSPTGRSGCCFHLTGSLGDIGSALYHLQREMEEGEVQVMTDLRWGQQSIWLIEAKMSPHANQCSLARTLIWSWSNHAPLCVSVKEKVNSGKK